MDRGETKKELAKRLWDLRMDAFPKLNDSQFAQKVGISKGSVTPIKHGFGTLTMPIMKKWVEGCGVLLTDFLSGKSGTEATVLPFTFHAKYLEVFELLGSVLAHCTTEEIALVTSQMNVLANSATARGSPSPAKGDGGRELAGSQHKRKTKAKGEPKNVA